MTEKRADIWCFVIFIVAMIAICYIGTHEPRERIMYRNDVIEHLEAINSKLDKLPYVPPMFRQGGNTGAIGESADEQ